MSKLSYRGKFSLIASLFSIPLILFAGRLALNFHAEAEQALLTRNGLEHLRDVTKLIENLEELRDSAMISFAADNELFTQYFEGAKIKIHRQIDELKSSPSLASHEVFLDNLQNQITTNRLFPGNEGGGINAVFENAYTLVEQVYLWRVKLSYEFVPVTQANQDIVTIFNMINNSDAYFIALGKARAYGSFYLHRKHINSQGISLIDDSYQELSRLIYDSSTHSHEYTALSKGFPTHNTINIGTLLGEARTLLDEQLIQSVELEADAAIYYQKNTAIIQQLYQYNYTLFELASQLLDENYQETQNNQRLFYGLTFILVASLIYLFIGFFSYLQITITELVQSARKVAQGEYSEAIEIQAEDELRSLAGAMDEMRKKLKLREEDLRKVAQTDGLTGLNNRRFFDDSLPLSIANGRRSRVPVSVVLMDIDHFKSINDTYGHQVGDECLKRAASLFKTRFKRTTDIAARYGGEEFVAVIYGQDKDTAIAHTEDLRKQLEEMIIESHNVRVSITSSFGIATLNPLELATADELVGLADAMLYKAKESGRNRVLQANFSAQSGTQNG